MKQNLQFNTVLKFLITVGDLLIMNALFFFLYQLFDKATLGKGLTYSVPQILVLLNLVYLVCNYQNGVILYRRIIRPDHIIRKSLRNVGLLALVFTTLYALAHFGKLSVRFFLTFYLLFFVIQCVYRITVRILLKRYRRLGGNSRRLILIGDDENMHEIYLEVSGDSAYGLLLQGYFAPAPSRFYPDNLPYLGTIEQIMPWMESHPTEIVCCGVSSSYGKYILPIINYCEDHFIQFFSIPSVRNYLKRRMHMEMIGSIPVLVIRNEPLAHFENRLLKRTFDVICSALFLCTLFPIIYIVVGIAIKLSSPGPILFRQKRTGANGREFWCYKFRSMRVNADSDNIQATQHDPRKTRVGNFLRKSSIDELPQFINVLLGDMSLVGPRPHMLKHTDEYSHLIRQYMIRHLVKPGITGWAQVNGFRGETKELWQMDGRVKLDIWYIEHWTPVLDFYILYLTVKQVIKGDKQAY